MNYFRSDGIPEDILLGGPGTEKGGSEGERRKREKRWAPPEPPKYFHFASIRRIRKPWCGVV